jgi:hypothetical protein
MLEIPKIIGTNTLEFFLVVLCNLDINYIITQDFYNTQLIADNKLVLEILDVIENYFNYYYCFQAIVLQPVIYLGCVLGSHLVVPPTGNPPIGLGNRPQPNWDLKTQ